MKEIPIAHLQPSAKRKSLPSKSTKKVSIFMLAGFIALVMLVWLGFLSWGLFAAAKWLLGGLVG